MFYWKNVQNPSPIVFLSGSVHGKNNQQRINQKSFKSWADIAVRSNQ